MRLLYKEYELLDGRKKELLQQVGNGRIIKRFDKISRPKNEDDIVCPDFLELKWAYGCPNKCGYCYLQGTLWRLKTKTSPVVKPYDLIEKHVESFLDYQQEKELVNSGEIADSLMHENSNSPFSKFIMPLFDNQNTHKVLFLTKVSYVKNLVEMGRSDQAIISFSLNADKVAKRWEIGAPPVSSRIKAAKDVWETGYETRIRIDPIVPIDNWKSYYKNMIDELMENLVPDMITIGSLRGKKSTIRHARDKSWCIYLGEPSSWGKKIKFDKRFEIYSYVIDYLENEWFYEGVSLCKETLRMWNQLGLDYQKMKCNCIL